MFSSSYKIKSYKCRTIHSDREVDDVFSRQHLIPGFEHDVFFKLTIGLIGAGGLGSEIGEGLVRKGIGSLRIYDFDVVEPSNLNRQLYTGKDIFKPKAFRLARNLSKMGFGGSLLSGVNLSFQQALEENLVSDPDVLICGVDNQEARYDACEYATQKNLPVVYTAVSRDGNSGYSFVQEPLKACFGCAFADISSTADKKKQNKCAPDPAVKDILKVVAGLVLYAVDSLFMDRKRNWNYREVFLAGFAGERIMNIEKRKTCPVCGFSKKYS
jgi:molybdopterin/thiamine biosynthesis adenylyltransferase